MRLSEEQITLHLAQTSRLQLSPETPYTPLIARDNPRFAAVLIPFICQDNAWQVLFIRRSLNKNDRHGGQVAFPGGHCEPKDDNARAAALREAHEEIGVKPEDVRILGQLRDVITITNIQITPFVGVIPWPYTLFPQPEEVSRIFSIPLSWLIDPANREVRYHEILYQGHSIPMIHFSRYDSEILWGASARMIVLLLEALGFATPEERYKV
jgi:8-oxo-dGTP pyrophosphatase MutT (NUDIX family)